ncbi:energy-coupling factor transport system substrate-specific component [Fontibacillus phaseoli]|uniref:Energy-coupling factor transport system substrate-specific component n=2 Tax=Fontibacillus phaseoli TaxID=1416533 RepID=A0A369B4F5_9BACL|nr:energy-coupling factor transport system substrate-specific component [Fontibacillus phaseoli]
MNMNDRVKTRIFPFKAFTTLDIVLMAMLAAANAVMTVYLSPLNQALNGLGGPIAASTVTGLYMIYGLLACYIIRKPGTAVITYGIGAVVQAFMGSAYGIASCFVAAACYMVVAEAVFAFFRYRKWNMPVMLLAGGALVPIWFFFAARMFGYTKWGTDILLIALVVRILSGIVLCGMLSKLLGDTLARSGLLRRFAVKQGAEG